MKNHLLFLFSTLLMASSSWANPFDHNFLREARHLLKINQPTAYDTGAQACKDRYSNLFQDDELNIMVAFGYGDDYHTKVVSPELAQTFRSMVAMPECPKGLNACGFKRDPKNPEIYRKTIMTPDGKPHRVRLHFVSGAFTRNNDINVGALKARQKAHCLDANRKFSQAISSGSEVVLYTGHARNGGGPDFCPPIRKADGHTNYDFYEEKKLGVNVMHASLELARARGVHNEILGLFACSSQRHFLKELLEKTPETGFLVTQNQHSHLHMAFMAYASLDSILGGRCYKGFEESLKYGGVGRLRNMFPSK